MTMKPILFNVATVIEMNSGAKADAIMVSVIGPKDIDTVVLWELTEPDGNKLYGIVDAITGKCFDCFSVEQAVNVFLDTCRIESERRIPQ